MWILLCMWVVAFTTFTDCFREDVPLIRNLSDIPQDNYGRPGLTHMTIAGAVQHGMKEVEVWLQTFAAGSGTPIHRHACEEVFWVLKGTGSLYVLNSDKVHEFRISSNSTFTIPADAVHQVRNNDDSVEDLQMLVVISRPPIKVFVYENWFTEYSDAKSMFPYYWDK